MFKPTSKTLINKARALGIPLDEQKVLDTQNKTKGVLKYSNWELTRLIANKNLINIYGTKDKIPKSLLHRTQLQSMMLCKRYTELKPEQQDFLLQDGNNYVAEEKFNGNRCSIYYTPEEGFKFYSNNRDTQTLIPVDNTAQIIWDTTICRNKLPYSFILDCEVVCHNKHIDSSFAGGVISESELSSVNILLQTSPEVSHQIQRTQSDAELQFYIFDMPFYKGNLTQKPFIERRKAMEKLVKHLTQTYHLPFHIPKLYETDKKCYFEQLVDNMHEGVVLKNLNGIYTFDETRSIDRQVKLKRSLSMTADSDIDVFITGAIKATEGKRNERFIGGFELSCILRGFAGDKIHHIASISSLPDELRKEATVYNEKNEPILNPDFLHKVLTIDGFDIKQSSMRFSHARADWNTCFRPDKNYTQCVIMEDWLQEQCL